MEEINTSTGTVGFVINPYDPCVANKIINGSQFMIIWHVDDLKMSHADPRVLDAFLDNLNQVLGKESPAVVHKGPRDDFFFASFYGYNF